MLSTRLFINSARISPQIYAATRHQFYGNHNNSIMKSSTNSIHTLVNNPKQMDLMEKFNWIDGGTCMKNRARQYSNLPNLPSSGKVEKYIFLTIGFVWDLAKYLYILAMKLIQQYVVNNSKVQCYWELLHKKIADARRKN